jgi:hypothetical protein
MRSWLIVTATALSPMISRFLADAIGWLRGALRVRGRAIVPGADRVMARSDCSGGPLIAASLYRHRRLLWPRDQPDADRQGALSLPGRAGAGLTRPGADRWVAD